MKRILSVLLLLSFCLYVLSGCVFVANDTSEKGEGIDKDNSKTSSESETLIGKYDDIDFDGKDYYLEYSDDCLTGIYINPEADDGICIDIPAVCENGKPLREISLDPQIGSLLLPMYTVEAFQAIVDQMSRNSSSPRDSKLYAAFFILMDPNDETLPEKAKERILQEFPITAYCPIYWLEPTISSREIVRLNRLLIEYTDVDVEYLNKVASEMLDFIPDDDECKEEYAEKFNLPLREMKYGGFEKVTEINFPKTKGGISIDVNGFYGYQNLAKVKGDFSNYTVDSRKVDKTFIELIKSGEYAKEKKDNPLLLALVTSYDEGDVTVAPDIAVED